MRKTTMLATAIGTALAATGCGGSKECGQAECSALIEAAVAEAQAANPAGPTFTEFEGSLLTPLIDDIRAGVRPFSDESVGVCQGERTCDVFLGTDAGELEEGNYIVMAELRVPNVGEPGTWTIDFSTSCEITRTDANGNTSTSTAESSRSYDVRYAGTERGYRLMPLRTIESPTSGGSRSCTYTITAPHPDGDKVYMGSWTTPQAPE